MRSRLLRAYYLAHRDEYGLSGDRESLPKRVQPTGKMVIGASCRRRSPKPQPLPEIGTKSRAFDPTRPRGKLKLTNTNRRPPRERPVPLQ